MNTMSSSRKTPKPKQKLTKKNKIWVIIGSILAIITIIAIIIWILIEKEVIGYKYTCPDGQEYNCLFGDCECPYSHYGPHDIAKPIIYLYPESPTEVSVTLGRPNKLTASYPEYKDGWHVLAEPNGNLKDLSTGRNLYSLYWEGDQGNFEIKDEGFVVAGSKVASFLEEKLAILGLNERETEEFIVYWLPVMQQNNYNYVRFASSEEIKNYMPLIVTPTPDTIIRVLMITKPLESPINLKEQTLKTPTRSGFTVVEWGGTK